MPRRAVPAHGGRGARLQHRDPWAEDVQRRRHPLEAPVRGRARPARRRERLRSRAMSRRSSRPETAWCGWRASIFRTAIRSDSEKYPYKLAFMERLILHARQLHRIRGAAGSGRRFQRHSGRARRAPVPRTGSDDALFLPQTRCEVPRAPGAWLDRRPARDDGRARPLHVLGLSGGRVAEEQRHSRSTTCFCPPQAADRLQSAAAIRRGDARAQTKRPTTRRFGSNWPCDTRAAWSV